MRPFYRFAYNIVGLELFFHRITYEGRENVPTGGCLIVSNHVSFMDPTTVGWALGREIFFLGRKSLFKPPFWSRFLPMVNVLPIDRDGHDIAGLRRIIKMLRESHGILLFPEGTRSPDGTIQPAEPGGPRRAQGRRTRSAVPRLRNLRKPFATREAPPLSPDPRRHRQALHANRARRRPR